MNYTIVNIVASTQVNDLLDLDKLNKYFSNSEYDPEIYYALIYRIENPKLSILVNKSGKIIFTGSKSLNQIYSAREQFYNDLSSIDYNPTQSRIQVQNIVFNTKYHTKINLKAFHNQNQETSNKKNKFPGLVFRNIHPKFTALVFNSGKISIVGLTKINQIEEAITIMYDLINKSNLQITSGDKK